MESNIHVYGINKWFSCAIYCCATADILTKLLQQCFLFFIVVVILGHNLCNDQISDTFAKYACVSRVIRKKQNYFHEAGKVKILAFIHIKRNNYTT